MKEEFKLSDKIEGSFKSVGRSVPIGDIKEFIKLLKEEIKSEVLLCNCEIAEDRAEEIINNLSGDLKWWIIQ